MWKRAWRAGSLPALADAVTLCTRAGRTLPAWAILGLRRVLADRFRGQTRRGLGRRARPETAYREDMRHYERWSAVMELQERQAELAAGMKLQEREWQVHGRSFPDGLRCRHQLIVNATTLEERCEAVAEFLKGTEAAGTARTILRSYRLVECHLKKGHGARYYMGSLASFRRG